MTDSNAANPPSPFIAHWIGRLATEFPANSRALDIATGRGRHAIAMAAAGFRVTGIDIQMDSLCSARESARLAGHPLSLVCADLTRFPLPPARFQLVVVSRYLDRALFPALRDTLAPGGVVIYETLNERQLAHGRGPRSPDHLLKPHELRTALAGLEVLFEEEVFETYELGRIVARRR